MLCLKPATFIQFNNLNRLSHFNLFFFLNATFFWLAATKLEQQVGGTVVFKVKSMCLKHGARANSSKMFSHISKETVTRLRKGRKENFWQLRKRETLLSENPTVLTLIPLPVCPADSLQSNLFLFFLAREMIQHNSFPLRFPWPKSNSLHP